MKAILLMGLAGLVFLSAPAQQNKMIKKWHANTVKAETGTADPADLQKQISILKILKKTGDQAFTGNIEYGMKPAQVSSPCSITTNGKDIHITAGDMNWSGQVLESKDETMVWQLGSLTYLFKMVLVPLRSRNKPPQYPIESFYGSWQETGRAKARDNGPLNIQAKDTLYIRMSKDGAMYRPGISNRPMYGTMDLTDGDKLNIAENDFTVKTLTAQSLVLIENGEIMHTLGKIQRPFAFENKPVFCADCKVDLRQSMLTKNWYTFRIAPENAAQQADCISSLNISGKNADNSYSGTISFGIISEKKFITEPCTINFAETIMTITSRSYQWVGEMYRSDGDTLIFGKEKERVFYLKKWDVEKTPGLENGIQKTDLQAASLIHRWSAYKTEAMPDFIKPEMAIIRQLDINESADAMNFKGKVQFDKSGKRVTQDCTIEFYADKNTLLTRVKVLTSGQSWDTELFKADGKEMIMGRKTDGVRYYFRKLD